ncbi:MAG: hypothetical protein AAGA03_09825, partial [Planctomycetota bacterium]
YDGYAGTLPEAYQLAVSPDGREGPGSYGLNRNVALTMLFAKDGQVIHNLSMVQPMLYTDPHVIGALADLVEADHKTVLTWLQDGSKTGASKMMK